MQADVKARSSFSMQCVGRCAQVSSEKKLKLLIAVDSVHSLRDFIACLLDQFEKFVSTAKKLPPNVIETSKVDITLKLII